MIETCTTRRMLLLIGALLASTTVVLLFEEYVEDSELEAQRQLRQNGRLVSAKLSAQGVPEVSQSQCSTESLKLMEECQPCSKFEVKALQSEYCRETGFYSRFLCEATNQTVFSACYAKQMRSFIRFNVFAAISFAWSGLFYTFVSWRRKVVEARSYSRLSQFLN